MIPWDDPIFLSRHSIQHYQTYKAKEEVKINAFINKFILSNQTSWWGNNVIKNHPIKKAKNYLQVEASYKLPSDLHAELVTHNFMDHTVNTVNTFMLFFFYCPKICSQYVRGEINWKMLRKRAKLCWENREKNILETSSLRHPAFSLSGGSLGESECLCWK